MEYVEDGIVEFSRWGFVIFVLDQIENWNFRVANASQYKRHLSGTESVAYQFNVERAEVL
jgi:hypothetical protein